jgi:curved DNA-binding protein CbpA
MDSSDLDRLLVLAEQLSPERYPERAITLNQQIVQLDPQNAAAYVRLARAYQAQRDFPSAVAACQDALRHNPESIAAQRRLQRITEEWDFFRQVQKITTYDEALRWRTIYKDRELREGVIACLWRALELSSSQRQEIACRNALAAAYRSKKDAASFDLASAQYEWVLRLAPDNPTARRGMVAVLREQQRHQREGRREYQRQQRRQRFQQQKAEQQRKAAQAAMKKPATLAEALVILNLKPPATRTQIKRAYRAQARVAHPDHGGSHAAMVALNAAYELALASA